MDLTEAIVPNSQQVNADDLAASPRTVTITNVERGTDEQKVFVHLAEFPGRTYRPSKSMARVMVEMWGKESSTYTGRRLTLYRNPDITFGRDRVGGIEISHMSDIEKPKTFLLTKSRGVKRSFTVQPLPDATPSTPTIDPTAITEWTEQLAAADTLAALQSVWRDAGVAGVQGHTAIVAAKDARKVELSKPIDPADPNYREPTK